MKKNICGVIRSEIASAMLLINMQKNITSRNNYLQGGIANEMLEWKFPDGTSLDGLSGGGIGYAQIAIKTARVHRITGSDAEIKKMLNSYAGSVEAAAKILKDYVT